MIPFLNISIPARGPEAVADQVMTGYVGPGKMTARFSNALEDLVDAHVVLTVSGTVALTMAAMSARVPAGSAILIPAYGVAATANAFAGAGWKPHLVDICRSTGLIDVEQCADLIRKYSYRAVCYVDFSGHSDAGLNDLEDFCTDRKVLLIEDAACALGKSLFGRMSGTFGDVGIYSFSPAKILTTGQGGAIVSKNKWIKKAASGYIDHGGGWRETNLHERLGTNLRFNNVLAALGVAGLEEIDGHLKLRETVRQVFRTLLGPLIYGADFDEAPLHNIVFPSDPTSLIEHLKKKDIVAVRQYRTISQHPFYSHLKGEYPNADWWTDHAVYLPFGNGLSVEKAAQIADAVESYDGELLEP